MIQYLKWDSEFFNLKIGKSVTFNDEIVSEMESDNFDLLYVFAKNPTCENLIYLQKYNANLVDTKVIFHKHLDFKLDNETLFEFNEIDDVNQLIYLAIESGHKSRFRLDKNFEAKKFEEMYENWILNSLKDTSSTKVFVYRDNFKLGGFVTVEIKNGIGTIGLIAVDETLRGNGIGAKLIKQVEFYLMQSSVSELEVATQLENFGACEFYKQSGFNIKETINIYHLWKIKMK